MNNAWDTRILHGLLLSILSLMYMPVQAWPAAGYADVNFGLSGQYNSRVAEEYRSTLSDTLQVRAGVSVLPILSVGLNAQTWGAGFLLGNRAFDDDYAQLSGLGAGIEATVHLPLNGWRSNPAGPYARVGQQCWALSVSQPTANEQERRISHRNLNGCSVRQTVGVAFPAEEWNQTIYVEYSRIDFDYISSGSVIAGLRMEF